MNYIDMFSDNHSWSFTKNSLTVNTSFNYSFITESKKLTNSVLKC